MKFCHKCGAQCEDGAKFCKQCGAALADVNANQSQQTYEVPRQAQYTSADTNNSQNAYGNQNNYGNQNQYGGPAGGMNQRFPGIQERNIAIAVILSIVTCGLYGIYWMIKLNDEVNQTTGGGLVFLFTLITCGIYGWYWMYKMGEKCDQIKGVNGSSEILYLILGIFGLGIVSYCLMQDTINKAIM